MQAFRTVRRPENFLCERASERERANERRIIAAWRVRKRHCSTAKRSTRSSFGAYRARGKRHADAKESSTRSKRYSRGRKKTPTARYIIYLVLRSLFLPLPRGSSPYLTLPETGRTEQRQSCTKSSTPARRKKRPRSSCCSFGTRKRKKRERECRTTCGN